MQTRPVTGTVDEKEYEIVLDVPVTGMVQQKVRKEPINLGFRALRD